MSNYINSKILKARHERMIRAGWTKQDFISAQIHQRHLESLDTISLPNGLVLDLGCGHAAKLNHPKFSANNIRLDLINSPSAQLDLCANAEALPFKDASFGVVWANNVLPWVGEILKLMQEISRILVEGGLFTFTSLGPATLNEIHDLNLGSNSRTLGFIDMHDLADMSMAAGFAEPVATCETIKLSYKNYQTMFNELKTFGVLASDGMITSLGEPKKLQKLINCQEAINLSFEVIYIHAWALPARVPKGPSDWQEINFQRSVKT